MAPELFPVYDQRGRPIGTVQRVYLGRGRKLFWDALSLDGCDLGAHSDRVEAEWTIQDDWEAGRPRNARSPRQRHRPIYDRDPPIYLGQ